MKSQEKIGKTSLTTQKTSSELSDYVQYLDKYMSSWPEWKKSSGFCYNSSVIDFNQTSLATQLAMGETDYSK